MNDTVNLAHECNQTENQQPQVDLFEFIVTGVLQGLLCPVGLIGNIISFAVWSRESTTWASTNFLFRFMAFSDFLYVIVVLLQSVILTIGKYYPQLLAGYTQFLLCTMPYQWPVLWTCKALTIWTVVVVALDRYRLVCRPFCARVQRSRQRVKVVCAGLVLAAAAYNLPRWFEMTVVVDTPSDACTNQTVRSIVYTDLFLHNRLYNILYVTVGVILTYYVIPLSIVIFCVARLTAALKIGLKTRDGAIENFVSQRLSNSVSQRPSNSITRMLIAILIIFITCEIPQFVYTLMYSTALLDNSDSVYMHLFERNYFYVQMYHSLADLCFTAQSCLNVFVYAIYAKRFRAIMCGTTCARTAESANDRASNHSNQSTEMLYVAPPDDSGENDDWPAPPSPEELWPNKSPVWSTSGQLNQNFLDDEGRRQIIVLTDDVIKNWDFKPKSETPPKSVLNRGIVYLRRLSRRHYSRVQRQLSDDAEDISSRSVAIETSTRSVPMETCARSVSMETNTRSVPMETSSRSVPMETSSRSVFMGTSSRSVSMKEKSDSVDKDHDTNEKYSYNLESFTNGNAFPSADEFQV